MFRSQKPDPEFIPLYLTQGSFVFIFLNAFAARLAFEECEKSFYGDGCFRGYKIKTKIESQQPWFIPEHNCIVCGVGELPPNFESDPTQDDMLVCDRPPICIGNQIKLLGLASVRNQTAVPIKKRIVLAAMA